MYITYTYIYILDLAFEDDNLPGGDDAMSSARALVGHFKSSTQSLEKLLENQRITGVKIPLSVIQDVVTRWWSTYSMCERLVVLKLYIQLLVGSNKQIPNLTTAQWNIIESQVAVLEPFMHIQKMIEGQKYVNISLIPYLVFKVRKHLVTSIASYSAAGQSPSILALLKKMLVDFNDRWYSTHPNWYSILALTSLLKPPLWYSTLTLTHPKP